MYSTKENCEPFAPSARSPECTRIVSYSSGTRDELSTDPNLTVTRCVFGGSHACRRTRARARPAARETRTTAVAFDFLLLREKGGTQESTFRQSSRHTTHTAAYFASRVVPPIRSTAVLCLALYEIERSIARPSDFPSFMGDFNSIVLHTFVCAMCKDTARKAAVKPFCVFLCRALLVCHQTQSGHPRSWIFTSRFE